MTRRWMESVTMLAKRIKAKDFPDWSKDDAIRSLEYYEEQYIMDEEDMTFKEAEKYEKKIDVLKKYVFTLYPDYKAKRDAEDARRRAKFEQMEKEGKIQCFSISWDENGNMKTTPSSVAQA